MGALSFEEQVNGQDQLLDDSPSAAVIGTAGILQAVQAAGQLIDATPTDRVGHGSVKDHELGGTSMRTNLWTAAASLKGCHQGGIAKGVAPSSILSKHVCSHVPLRCTTRHSKPKITDNPQCEL